MVVCLSEGVMYKDKKMLYWHAYTLMKASLYIPRCTWTQPVSASVLFQSTHFFRCVLHMKLGHRPQTGVKQINKRILKRAGRVSQSAGWVSEILTTFSALTGATPLQTVVLMLTPASPAKVTGRILGSLSHDLPSCAAVAGTWGQMVWNDETTGFDDDMEVKWC